MTIRRIATDTERLKPPNKAIEDGANIFLRQTGFPLHSAPLGEKCVNLSEQI